MTLSPKIMLTLTSCLLLACQPFSVSLNDKVMYTPAPLFTDFRVADRNLQTCLDQTIQDARATAADQIKTLNCSNAGIESLVGIGVFSAIESLNLADNAIVDVAPLKDLTRLQTLILRNNKIAQGDSLLNLLHLLSADLSENTGFDCAINNQLERNLAAQKAHLIWPAHCLANQ